MGKLSNWKLGLLILLGIGVVAIGEPTGSARAANISGSQAISSLFPDANLAKAVASSMGYGTNTSQKVNQTQLNQVGGVSTFNSTTNSGVDVSSVEGVQYLNNVSTFSIEQGKLVTDLTPFSKVGSGGYKYLTDLNLAGNNITNVAPLAAVGMPILNRLRLNQNSNLVDISPLAKLTTVTDLSIQDDKVSDITALGSLKNLTTLYAANNQINSIDPLANTTSLTTLFAEKNNLSNIKAVTNLTNLTTLSVMTERGMNNGYMGLDDVSPVSKLTKLQTLYINNNQISNISPLSGLTNLKLINAAYNMISDITPLQNIDLTQSGTSTANQTVVSGNPITYSGQQKAVTTNQVKNKTGAIVAPITYPTWGTNYWNPENANYAISDNGTYNAGNVEWPLGNNWSDPVANNKQTTLPGTANNGYPVMNDVWYSWKTDASNGNFSGWWASPVKEYSSSLSWDASSSVAAKNQTFNINNAANGVSLPFYWSNNDPNKKTVYFKVTGGSGKATVKTTNAATGSTTVNTNQLNIAAADLKDGDKYTVTSYNLVNGQEYDIASITLTLQNTGYLGFVSAPSGLTTTNKLDVAGTDKTYPLQVIDGAPLVVQDTRVNQQPWQLSVSYTPFKSTGNQLAGSILQYKNNGQAITIDTSGTSTPVYKQSDPLGMNAKNISAGWNTDNGPMVKIPANTGKKGTTYKSTINWSLVNAPS